MKAPFNGCRSHRLNLAAGRWYNIGDHDKRPIHCTSTKAQKSMVKLNQLKNASLVKSTTLFRVMFWNKTQSSSNFDMIEHLLVLRPHTVEINWLGGGNFVPESKAV